MASEDRAIILCGGLGTRLRPAVAEVPKSMAPVRGRPFLEYLVAQLRLNGFASVVMCAGFKAETIRAHFGDGQRFGLEIEYSIESAPLGTGGALRLAAPKLVGRRWLLMNGDSLFDISLRELLDAHDRARTDITIALAHMADARRYGRVTLDEDGVVAGFNTNTDSSAPGLINSGLYIIQRSLLGLIPADRPVSFERDVVTSLIGHGVRGAVFDGYFVDIGVPEDYTRAQQAAAFDRIIR